jgi:hypothetical protein
VPPIVIEGYHAATVGMFYLDSRCRHAIVTTRFVPVLSTCGASAGGSSNASSSEATAAEIPSASSEHRSHQRVAFKDQHLHR